MAAQKGLILVDTKYEFGKIGDKIILIDEIHTPDSSRFSMPKVMKIVLPVARNNVSYRKSSCVNG